MYVDHLLYDFLSHVGLLVLDPRISYDSVRADYANDDTLAEHVESSKLALFDYFHKYYGNKATPDTSPSSMTAPSHVPPSSHSMPSTVESSKKSFMARYHQKDKPAVNELKEYFKLPLEDFDACNPIQWWVSWRAQFPNLYCLACDILCIPGE
jgi:hypothetical protein